MLWLQVNLLPLQENCSGPGKEADLAFPVANLPLFRGVVEFDVAGPGDLKPSKFM